MVTIPMRWNPEIWAAIQIEAQHAGMSASEFVRQGATMNLAIHAVQRRAPVVGAVAELAGAARRVVEAYPDPPEHP